MITSERQSTGLQSTGLLKGYWANTLLMVIALICVMPAQTMESAFEYDHDFVRPSARAVMGQGVDARTGSYSYNHSDLSIGSEGAELALERGYVSTHLSHPVASFGLGTYHNLDIYLVLHQRRYCTGFACGDESMVAM